MTAPAELVIEVTAEDIRLGEQKSCARCPIARAAARLLGRALPGDDLGAAMVTVTAVALDAWDGAGECVTYTLPVQATRFIEDFDQGGPGAVKPVTFTARRWDA